MAYLKRCYKQEKDTRWRDRLSAHTQRKAGKTAGKIAANVDRRGSAAHNWLARALDEGIRARGEREGRGRKCRPDGAQIKQLAADLDKGPERCGFGSGQWNSDLASLHVKQKFGAE